MYSLWTAQALYDAVVARYSSPTTATLGRLLLPYLFPELTAFATVADVVTHLRTSDARYRATVSAEFLAMNQPPMFITLYFIFSRLPDSLRSVRDHFLSLDPTSLTVDLLKQHLLTAETSAVPVGAARGTLRLPFFEGCSPSPLSPSLASAAAADVSVPEDVSAGSTSAKRCARARVAGLVEVAVVVVGVAVGAVVGAEVEVVEALEMVAAVGLVAAVGALVPAMEAAEGVAAVKVVGLVVAGLDLGVEAVVPKYYSGTVIALPFSLQASSRQQQQQRRSESLLPQQLREWLVQRGTGGGSETCSYVIRTGVRVGQTCGKFTTEHRCFSCLDDAWRAEFGDDVERPRWMDFLRSGVAIFDLNYDAIISAMYALSFSAEGDCYRCVPPDPCIAAFALGASAFGTPPGTAPAEALHTFTLDSGASRCFFRDSTTLTPLLAPVLVRLADPSVGPVVASSSTVLPYPAVLSGSLSGLYLPSFSTNLVSTAALQDAMVTTTTPRGQRVSICTCTRTGRHLATSGSRLLLVSPPVAPDSSVAPPPGSPLPAMPSLHALTVSRLWSTQVFASPDALACPALPSLRRRAAACRSSLLLVSPDDCSPPDSHMDMWGPAHVSGQGRERYFLLVVDDYTWYTTLRERFDTDLPVLPLHSDRGGEFSSDLLRDFCRGEGILQSFTLPDSPQQNGIAERRIGLVMEVARMSMIHAATPHFLWPFAVWYAAHQLNLWPCVSLWETSSTLRWTGKVGDASVFRDVTFDESVPFYRLFPYGSAPPRPLPLFLAPGPPPVDPLPPQGPAPSGVSQVDPLPSTAPVQVAVGSGAALDAASGGAASGGATSGGAEPGGAGSEGAGFEVAELEGVELGGAESEGADSWGAAPRGAASSGGPAGASPRPSSLHMREWLVRRAHCLSGAPGAGGSGDTGAGGATVHARAGGTGGTATTGPGGARTSGAGAAGTSGVGCIEAGDPTEPGGAGAGGARVGGPGAGGARATGAGVGDTSAGGAGAAGARAIDPGAGGAGGTVRPRPYFVPLLQQVLGVPSSTGLPSPLLFPPPDQSQPPLQPASPLPTPSPYTEQSGGLTECREPASHPVSPVRTARRAPRSRPSPVPGTHTMALLCCCALVAELLDFAAACRLDYATALVVESVSASPPSVGGECALGTDVLEDRVKRPPGSPLAFKRDYELHSLDFSTAFLQGSLHEEIWLRRPPGFTGTKLAALGFAPSTADPSPFLRTDMSLPPFYVLVYVDDLVFATADTEALTLVKSELQKRHTCNDLGELSSYLGLQITRERARRTITLTQSQMVHQVLQRFGFQFSSPQPTPLSTSHSLSAPPSDESVEPSGPYPELVGCLITSGMGLVLEGRAPVVLTGHAGASWVDDSATQRSSQGYTFSLGSGSVSWRSTRSSSVLSSSCEAEIYAGAMAAQELHWLTYLLTDLGEQPRSPPVLYVDNKAMIALCQEHRLEHRTKHIALRYFLARELQQRGQLRLAYVATRANTADVFTKALPPGDHQRFATLLGLVPTLPHLLTA
ncbi:unnamed protein product [Closterium sp. NIES-53]